MALIFVTGTSGSGKSTITLELRKRGFIAFDTDDNALARWQNLETGYIHPKSSVKAHMRTPEFLAAHAWNVPREFIEKIIEDTPNKTVFICGTIHNFDQVKDLFAGVIALAIDEPTIRHRLTSRANNDWGKQPHELAQTIEANKRMLEFYAANNFPTINATRPLEEVVNDIIALT